MSDFITLACPSCGGKLEITDEIEHFACGHCGQEHLVKRSGGVISLAPVLQQIQNSADRTASELAIQRLNQEILEIEGRIAQHEREDIAQHGINIFSVIAAICFIFAFAGGIDWSSRFWSFIFVGGISSGVAWGFFRIRESELQPFREELEKRYCELIKHQQVVSQ